MARMRSASHWKTASVGDAALMNIAWFTEIRERSRPDEPDRSPGSPGIVEAPALCHGQRDDRQTGSAGLGRRRRFRTMRIVLQAATNTYVQTLGPDVSRPVR